MFWNASREPDNLGPGDMGLMQLDEVVGQTRLECLGTVSWLSPLIQVMRLGESKSREKGMESQLRVRARSWDMSSSLVVNVSQGSILTYSQG